VELNYPTGVAVDVEGNVVVTDHDNLLVRKIFQGGIVSTITGSVREGNRNTQHFGNLNTD
jgi:DNA-binding beta-propeller fold protein YncE